MSPAQVDIQNENFLPGPDEDILRQWIEAALRGAGHHQTVELTLRIVDEPEMHRLNRDYRNQDKSTNVLSFPAQLPAELKLPLLGDIVICSQVVKREALEQGKTENAHWAHMVVHGSLHLLGYDHIEENDAVAMEQLETRVLGDLHFAPPYEPQGLSRESDKP